MDFWRSVYGGALASAPSYVFIYVFCHFCTPARYARYADLRSALCRYKNFSPFGDIRRRRVCISHDIKKDLGKWPFWSPSPTNLSRYRDQSSLVSQISYHHNIWWLILPPVNWFLFIWNYDSHSKGLSERSSLIWTFAQLPLGLLPDQISQKKSCVSFGIKKNCLLKALLLWRLQPRSPKPAVERCINLGSSLNKRLNLENVR